MRGQQKRNTIIAISVFVAAAVLVAVLALVLSKAGGKDGSSLSQSGEQGNVVGINLYIVSAPELQMGDTLDYSQFTMEYSMEMATDASGSTQQTTSGPRLPLTLEMIQASPETFSITPENGSQVLNTDFNITLYYTPPGQAVDTFAATTVYVPTYTPGEETPSEDPALEEPPASSEAPPASSSSAVEIQPAPKFIDGTPSVYMDGKTAKVTYKTDVGATINAIVATSGDSISVQSFYDHVRRGKTYQHAVATKTTGVSGGVARTETFELPDLSKSYWLLINAVENQTGTWQDTVTVIKLHTGGSGTPSSSSPGGIAFVGNPVRESGSLNFTLETTVQATVYVLIVDASGPAPTAQQIKAGGSGYTGANYYGSGSASTTTAAPFKATIATPNSSLPSGSYTLWFTAADSSGALASPTSAGITV